MVTNVRCNKVASKRIRCHAPARTNLFARAPPISAFAQKYIQVFSARRIAKGPQRELRAFLFPIAVTAVDKEGHKMTKFKANTPFLAHCNDEYYFLRNIVVVDAYFPIQMIRAFHCDLCFVWLIWK